MEMSDDEDFSGQYSLQERIRTAKAIRAVAKRKFSRKYKLFREMVHKDERALIILKDLFDEVSEAYQLVETYNDNYILLITENEEN